jgi:hypothetical protein
LTNEKRVTTKKQQQQKSNDGEGIKVTKGWMFSISDGINNQIEKKKILTIFIFFLSDVVSFVIFIAPSLFFLNLSFPRRPKSVFFCCFFVVVVVRINNPHRLA